jgi:basic amino acid/polyamine antiporter, APA family
MWAAISVNVSNMIGAGVFLKTRVMTCNVGSAKVVMLVWIAAGLLSLAGTFCYSEVAALMPEAGGDYVYLRRASGRSGRGARDFHERGPRRRARALAH